MVAEQRALFAPEPERAQVRFVIQKAFLNSDRFKCAICGGRVKKWFSQKVEIRYGAADSWGWSLHHRGHEFGHDTCLVGARKKILAAIRTDGYDQKD